MITPTKQTYYILLIWCIVHYQKVLNNDLIVPEKIIATIFLLLSTKTSYFTMLLQLSKVLWQTNWPIIIWRVKNPAQEDQSAYLLPHGPNIDF